MPTENEVIEQPVDDDSDQIARIEKLEAQVAEQAQTIQQFASFMQEVKEAMGEGDQPDPAAVAAPAKDAAVVAPVEEKKPAPAIDEAEVTKNVEKNIADKAAAYDEISEKVGAFKSTGMDAADVYAYGCSKVGIKADKSVARHAWAGYMAGAKANATVAVKGTGQDAADKAKPVSAFDAFTKGAK